MCDAAPGRRGSPRRSARRPGGRAADGGSREARGGGGSAGVGSAAGRSERRAGAGRTGPPPPGRLAGIDRGRGARPSSASWVTLPLGRRAPFLPPPRAPRRTPLPRGGREAVAARAVGRPTREGAAPWWRAEGRPEAPAGGAPCPLGGLRGARSGAESGCDEGTETALGVGGSGAGIEQAARRGAAKRASGRSQAPTARRGARPGREPGPSDPCRLAGRDSVGCRSEGEGPHHLGPRLRPVALLGSRPPRPAPRSPLIKTFGWEE